MQGRSGHLVALAPGSAERASLPHVLVHILVQADLPIFIFYAKRIERPASGARVCERILDADVGAPLSRFPSVSGSDSVSGSVFAVPLTVRRANGGVDPDSDSDTDPDQNPPPAFSLFLLVITPAAN